MTALGVVRWGECEARLTPGGWECYHRGARSLFAERSFRDALADSPGVTLRGDPELAALAGAALAVGGTWRAGPAPYRALTEAED